ncbi:MAG TPA: TraR/DksA C4-type zinc finger protein [Patescibacteria group bacterium]|nr:TraR/DksA C4-type zinc finger protein [Patescibacteria group bacterium]
MTKSPYSQEFLNEMKQVLLDRRGKIEKQLQGFAQADPNQKFNYNSNFPEFGDKEDENAAEVAAFESNLSLEETLEQSIEMINKALKKIENGTYGICEKTGEPIGEARLRIMPTATKKVPEKK